MNCFDQSRVRWYLGLLIVSMVLILGGCSRPAGEAGPDGIEPLAPVAPEAPVPEADDNVDPNVVLTAEAGGERDFVLGIGVAPALASGSEQEQTALMHGAQLAIQQVNQSDYMGNGRRMALMLGDSPVTDMGEVGEYEEPLFAQGLVALIGPVLRASSGEATVPLVLLSDAGVVNDTGSGSVSDWVFRSGEPSGELTLQTAQALDETLQLDSLALLYPASDPQIVGRVVDVIEQGMPETEILFTQEIDENSDLQAVLDDAAQLQPDAVLLSLPAALATRVLMTASDMGLNQLLFIGGAGVVNPGLFESMADVPQNLIGSTNWYAVSPADLDPSFADDYEAMFGMQPDELAARSYTAVWLLAEAVRQVGSADPGPLRDGLALLEGEVESPAGTLAFDSPVGPLRTPLLLEIGPDREIRELETD